MPALRRLLASVDASVDFSPRAVGVLGFAAAMGERLGASVDALHVWEVPALGEPEVIGPLPGRADLSHARARTA